MNDQTEKPPFHDNYTDYLRTGGVCMWNIWDFSPFSYSI